MNNGGHADIRVPLIAGNWKLHHTLEETRSWCETLATQTKHSDSELSLLVAPPFTALQTAAHSLAGSVIALAGQDCFFEDKGAYTGEVSAPLLKDIGCSHCIIGHSERRQYFGDDDTTVQRKVRALLEHGLIPILCVGESLTEREDGRATQVVVRQLGAALAGMDHLGSDSLVVAYEPVWAIGTGKTATPEDAQHMHRTIRDHLGKLMGVSSARHVRILYGGSVKPDNAYALMSGPDIDGALVGGASLNAKDFLSIAKESNRAWMSR